MSVRVGRQVGCKVVGKEAITFPKPLSRYAIALLHEMYTRTGKQTMVSIDVHTGRKIWLELSRWYLNIIYAQGYEIDVEIMKMERFEHSIAIVCGILDKADDDCLR